MRFELTLDLRLAPAGRQETMTVGVGAGPDVLQVRALRQFRTPDHERDDTSAIEKHQPADRTRKDEIASVVVEVCVPSHLFREGHAAKQRCHHLRKYVYRGFAALTHPIREVGALWRLLAFEHRHVESVLPRKTDRGWRRFAVRPERRRHGRAGN